MQLELRLALRVPGVDVWNFVILVRSRNTPYISLFFIMFVAMMYDHILTYDLFKVHLFVSTYFIFQTTIFEHIRTSYHKLPQIDLISLISNDFHRKRPDTASISQPPYWTMAIQRRVCLLVLGFSLTAGFIDLVTLVHFSQFAGLQTGNMILIGRDLYRLTLPDESKTELLKAIAFHVATLISHFAGVLGFCALAHTCKGPVRVGAWLKGRPVRVGAVLVGVLTLSGALLDLLSKGNEWSVCFIAASMGAMNFIPSPNSELGSKLFLMTVLTTGNLQKSAKMLFKLLICQRFTDAEKQQTCCAVTTIFGTILGALLGALALFGNPFASKPYGDSIYLLLMSPVQTVLLCLHDHMFRPPTDGDFNQQASTSLAAVPSSEA